MVEVNVNWTEIPGSKIRFTSIIHMALEMLIIKVTRSPFSHRHGCELAGGWERRA